MKSGELTVRMIKTRRGDEMNMLAVVRGPDEWIQKAGRNFYTS